MTVCWVFSVQCSAHNNDRLILMNLRNTIVRYTHCVCVCVCSEARKAYVMVDKHDRCDNTFSTMLVNLSASNWNWISIWTNFNWNCYAKMGLYAAGIRAWAIRVNWKHMPCMDVSCVFGIRLHHQRLKFFAEIDPSHHCVADEWVWHGFWIRCQGERIFKQQLFHINNVAKAHKQLPINSTHICIWTLWTSSNHHYYASYYIAKWIE